MASQALVTHKPHVFLGHTCHTVISAGPRVRARSKPSVRPSCALVGYKIICEAPLSLSPIVFACRAAIGFTAPFLELYGSGAAAKLPEHKNHGSNFFRGL